MRPKTVDGGAVLQVASVGVVGLHVLPGQGISYHVLPGGEEPNGHYFNSFGFFQINQKMIITIQIWIESITRSMSGEEEPNGHYFNSFGFFQINYSIFLFSTRQDL